jgi:hypothetical protein
LLFFEVLFLAFLICTKLWDGYPTWAIVNLSLICMKFDQELEILYVRMGLEVINVLDPFLAFVITWNLITTHNMCTFQQHPHLKSIWCVMECTSKDKTRAIVERYHEQVIMSLLLKVANNLNLQCVAILTSLAYHIF